MENIPYNMKELLHAQYVGKNMNVHQSMWYMPKTKCQIPKKKDPVTLEYQLTAHQLKVHK